MPAAGQLEKDRPVSGCRTSVQVNGLGRNRPATLRSARIRQGLKTTWKGKGPNQYAAGKIASPMHRRASAWFGASFLLACIASLGTGALVREDLRANQSFWLISPIVYVARYQHLRALVPF